MRSYSLRSMGSNLMRSPTRSSAMPPPKAGCAPPVQQGERRAADHVEAARRVQGLDRALAAGADHRALRVHMRGGSYLGA